MTFANYDDVLTQLVDHGLQLATAKKTHGGRPEGMIYLDSAKPVKVHAEGEVGYGGWYWLNEKDIRGHRCIVGAFGIYRGGDMGKVPVKVRLDGKAVALSPEELAAIKARNAANMKRAAALRQAEADRAAREAERVWRKYLPIGESDYLKRKGVGAHGLRFSPSGNGTVAVPMLRGGRVVGLQIIRGKNRLPRQYEKENFPAGIDMVGAYHTLGRIVTGGVVIVAEGYATAATIYEALGMTVPVVVAWNAGQLLPVAQAIAKAHRTSRVLVAADDDRIQRCRECKNLTAIDIETSQTAETVGGSGSPVDGENKQTPVSLNEPSGVYHCIHCHKPHGCHNPGVEAAQNAAHAVGGSHLVPVFSDPRPNDKKGPNDFNDLHALEGLHVVRQQLEAHLAGLGWTDTAPAARMHTAGGAGKPVHGNEGGGLNEDGSGRADLDNMVDIDTACERFAIVYGGKGTIFDHYEHCLVPKSDVLDILPDHGWRDWKQRSNRQIVRLSEVGFDPAETDETIRCNLWGGWPTTPKDGSCGRLLQVLEHLCAEERNSRELYQWILKWLAFPIQNPGAKMRTALVFHGPSGVGKNLFFEAVMRIYGQYGRIVDQAAVEDKFNDWMSGKLFMIADEVVARNELFHLKNKLKGIVTGEWIRINPKNVAAHDERNHVNLVFLSNERQPLVLEKDDRRYVVVWTPEKMDMSFYGEVNQELEAGGVAALHHYLLNLDLGDFNEHSAAPVTAAKKDLIDLGLDSIERFVRDWRGSDIRLSGHLLPFCPAGSADLYTAYKRWCVQEGVARPREQSAFLGHLTKLKGWRKGHMDRYKDTYCTGATVRSRMVVPSAEDLAEAAKVPGAPDYQRAEGKNQANWLTDCFFAFADVIGHPE